MAGSVYHPEECYYLSFLESLLWHSLRLHYDEHIQCLQEEKPTVHLMTRWNNSVLRPKQKKIQRGKFLSAPTTQNPCWYQIYSSVFICSITLYKFQIPPNLRLTSSEIHPHLQHGPSKRPRSSLTLEANNPICATQGSFWPSFSLGKTIAQLTMQIRALLHNYYDSSHQRVQYVCFIESIRQNKTKKGEIFILHLRTTTIFSQTKLPKPTILIPQTNNFLICIHLSNRLFWWNLRATKWID